MDNRTRLLFLALYAAAIAVQPKARGPTLPRLIRGLINALEAELGIAEEQNQAA